MQKRSSFKIAQSRCRAQGGPESASPQPRSAGGRPPAFDRGRYKERDTVERCSGKLRAVPRRRHPLRQARTGLPGHRRRRLDPDLAPGPVPWS